VTAFLNAPPVHVRMEGVECRVTTCLSMIALPDDVKASREALLPEWGQIVMNTPPAVKRGAVSSIRAYTLIAEISG